VFYCLSILEEALNDRAMLKRVFIPGLFVFLWSTGFIGSKVVMQFAPPLTFLALRMVLAALVLIPLLIWFKSAWPQNKVNYLHAACVGALVHGVYLGGVFWAISLGTGAGLSALIVGLQPLLTLCLAAVFLREKLYGLKIVGVVTGLIGFLIVISERTSVDELSIATLSLCIASLLGISIGTVYQKKISTEIELLPSVLMQYLGAAALLLPGAILLETPTITWNPEFVLATIWLVLGLSIGAVVLLMLLIRSADAGNVASLFYLVPPLTALEAYLLFGEQLSRLAITGTIICVAGVAMVLHSSDKLSRNDKLS